MNVCISVDECVYQCGRMYVSVWMNEERGRGSTHGAQPEHGVGARSFGAMYSCGKAAESSP